MQLEEIGKQFPNKRVGMVLFNDSVAILGDGLQVPQIISGDKLNNFEELLEIGKEYKLSAIGPVKESREKLSEKLFSLEEGGATALGPALAITCGICSQVPRAEIIVCTDG